MSSCKTGRACAAVLVARQADIASSVVLIIIERIV
jgi:hypothetical protein